MSFEPAVQPPETQEGTGYWFFFQENKLLVRLEGQSASLPLWDELHSLDIHPVRAQYLGMLEGRSCYSAELAAEVGPPEGMRFEQLRTLWGSLPEELFWIAGRGFQIMDWDRNHQFCGRCSSPTEDKSGERAKTCPECGLISYPRISPAVIVSITREDKILLARARRFPYAMYSVIAGFVDPGESLEQCVHREVREEGGITVKNLRYFGSQSWPFPNSLMVAFTAEHEEGEIRIDPAEIVDAGWYRVDQLPRIPDKVSIARRLIDSFIASAATEKRRTDR